MDIHQPTGDYFTNRPAIIFVHGGAFVSGNKNHDDMKAFRDTFALKGYVTTTIQYRLGMNTTDAASATRSVYRGLQDGRAAVRYLRANADTYGIGSTRIYMVGSSAGGFVALQDIYMDDVAKKHSAAVNYTYDDPTDFLSPISQITAPDLGAYDSGNYLTRNGKPDVIMSLWGAVKSSDLIIKDDTIPVFLVHGEDDDIVPFGTGFPFNLPTFPATYGSSAIRSALDALNFIDKKTYFVPGEEHEFHGVDNGMQTDGIG